jgi:hypothetical protein
VRKRKEVQEAYDQETNSDRRQSLRKQIVDIKDKEKRIMFPEAGTLPYPTAFNVGFAEKVWTVMSPNVQKHVLQLLECRRSMAEVQPLVNVNADLNENDAEQLGITPLHSVKGKVQLGVFEVPNLKAKHGIQNDHGGTSTSMHFF